MRRRAATGRSIRYRAAIALLVVGALWLLSSLLPSQPVVVATAKPTAKPTSPPPPTTMAPSPPSRADYSYQGPLANLFVAQLSGGGFEGQTQLQFERRLHKWRAHSQALESAAAATSGHLSAWPVAFHTHGYMFRSAMPLTSTLFVSIALSKPFSSPGVAFQPKTCVLARLTDRVADEELACTVEYSGSKMRFTLQEPARGVGAQPLAFFVGTTEGKSLVIPVEPLPPTDSPGQVHVCTQGILYPEQKFGPMPDDHVESLLQHYARFGADHLHFYTNSSYFADALLRGAAKLEEASSALQVWVHDTPLPKLTVALSDLSGITGGFQHFAINDCAMRSWAMGAAYVMYGDLDEYSFPTTATATTTAKLGELLAKESAAKFGDEPGVLYQSSHIFHTLYCDNAKAKSITERFTVSRLDAGTYQGRRKGIFCVGNMNADYLSRHVHFDVHDLGSLPHAMSSSVHLHHYREAWHPAVCSKRSSELATQGEWSTEHAKCGH